MIESYGLNDQPACISLTYQRTCQSAAWRKSRKSTSARKLASANQYTIITKQNTPAAIDWIQMLTDHH